MLSFLDSKLPADSHVLFMGMAKGSLLFKTLNGLQHPLGYFRQDVKYNQLYDFFNCLEISPCWGWMNTNATVREAADVWADSLTDQLTGIVAEHPQWTNFKLDFVPLPLDKFMAKWLAEGKEPSLLLERSDGFHPSQYMVNMLVSFPILSLSLSFSSDSFSIAIPPPPLSQVDQIVSSVDKDLVFGKVNPNNAKIIELFGSQGGY